MDYVVGAFIMVCVAVLSDVLVLTYLIAGYSGLIVQAIALAVGLPLVIKLSDRHDRRS